MKYFTFYGFNDSTQKIEKINRVDAEAIFIGQNRQKEDINVFDEAKKLVMTSKQNIYFDLQKFKAKKYGFCTLSSKTTFKKSEYNDDYTKFVFGYEMDIEKAREIFETIEQEEPTDSEVKTNEAVYDTKTYQIADEWLKTKREIDEIKANIKPAMEMFKNDFVDGEVITDGKNYYAVVIGLMPGTPMADSKKLSADGLKSKYSKLSKPPISVSVSDGVDLKTESVKMLVKSGLSPRDLISYADAVVVQTPILNEKEKQLDRLKNMLMQLCAEGTTKLKSVNKELVVNINKGNQREIVDVDKLKADGLFDKYCKMKADSRLVSVKKLS